MLKEHTHKACRRWYVLLPIRTASYPRCFLPALLPTRAAAYPCCRLSTLPPIRNSFDAAACGSGVHVVSTQPRQHAQVTAIKQPVGHINTEVSSIIRAHQYRGLINHQFRQIIRPGQFNTPLGPALDDAPPPIDRAAAASPPVSCPRRAPACHAPSRATCRASATCHATCPPSTCRVTCRVTSVSATCRVTWTCRVTCRASSPRHVTSRPRSAAAASAARRSRHGPRRRGSTASSRAVWRPATSRSA